NVPRSAQVWSHASRGTAPTLHTDPAPPAHITLTIRLNEGRAHALRAGVADRVDLDDLVVRESQRGVRLGHLVLGGRLPLAHHLALAEARVGLQERRVLVALEGRRRLRQHLAGEPG